MTTDNAITTAQDDAKQVSDESTCEEYRITRSTILDVPITGEYTEGVNWGPQLTAAEFAALLQPVLDDPEIVRFGWNQYTPYFNDGEPCEFGTYAPWFLTRADEVKLGAASVEDNDFDESDYEIDNSYSAHPSIGMVHSDRVYDSKQRRWITNADAGKFAGPDRGRYDRCLALSNAIAGSKCYRVLLDAFGDHTEVTFSRDADTGEWAAHREFYSHD